MDGSAIVDKFDVRLSEFNLGVGDPVRVLINDPRRISFIITCSTNTAIWPNSSALGAGGLFVPAAPANLTLLFKDHGALVSGEWFMYPGGGVNVSIIEVRYADKR